MKPRLNMDNIAKTLGAQRMGKIHTGGGYFGAAELVADIEKRFRIPDGGGRPTDPRWTEKRLVGLSTDTLQRLQEIAATIRAARHIHLNAMQVAALLLEKAIGEIPDPTYFEREVMGVRAPSSRGKAPREALDSRMAADS